MPTDERKLMAKIIEIAEEQNKMFSLIRQRIAALEDRLAVLEARRATGEEEGHDRTKPDSAA